jgi:opacity protein-like surface antigen
MKQHIIALALLCSSIATFSMSKPANAQPSESSLAESRRWSIGPSAEFGNGQTVFGIDSKFGISNNLSLRPFVYFPSGGTNFGTALTYDITLSNNAETLQLTPFVGGSVDFNTGDGNSTTSFGLVGGVDLDLTDSLRLKGAVNVPLSNDRDRTTTFTVGAGLRF